MRCIKIVKHLPILLIFWALTLSPLSCQENDSINEISLEHENEQSNFVPKNYSLSLKDDFSSFNANHWSKGLTHSDNPAIRMIWNNNTGGKHLLNAVWNILANNVKDSLGSSM